MKLLNFAAKRLVRREMLFETNRMRRETVITLTIILSYVAVQTLFLGPCSAQLTWSLDLTVQSVQAAEEGRHIFLPFDDVDMVARLSCNSDPISGIGVSFEIRGPNIGPNPTVVYRTAITDRGGIATISFRLPSNNVTEGSVLGNWQVFSSAATFPESIRTSLTFNVKTRPNVVVTQARLSATTIRRGEPLDITFEVTNKGSETGTVTTQISAGQVAIGNLTTVIEPLQTVKLNKTWETSNAMPGNYEIIVQAIKLPDEIDLEDNQVSAGTVTIEDSPIQQQNTNLFVLLLIVTGLVTATLILVFLKKPKDQQEHNKSVTPKTIASSPMQAQITIRKAKNNHIQRNRTRRRR
jgi:hypothetical protein